MTTLDSSPELKEQLENLHAHLTLIKTMKDNEKQNEFSILLEKAQAILGQVSPHIAVFYYSYGSFLLSKIQKNMDLFNPNAVPDAQEDGFVEEYDECYEIDSNEDENGANNDNEEKKQVTHNDEEKKQRVSQEETEKPTSHQKSNEKVLYEDSNMKITQIDDKLKQKLEENPDFLKKIQGDNQIEEQEEEDLTDIEVCYEYFQVALTIYEKQLKTIDQGQPSPLDRNQVIKYIFHIHGRLGELYTLDQKFDESIEEFQTVVKLATEYDHPETLRLISEAHFSIANNLLHQAKGNCEKQAIQNYISAVKCLIKYISEVERYDTQKFEIPTLDKPRVDRYQYLRAPKDNEMVAELKEVISIILDKIEDTYQQIPIKAAYEAEKRKMEKQKQDSGFKEVPKDVKVTNLGTFGNRKRTPTESSLSVEKQKVQIMKAMNPNAPNSSLRNSAASNEEEKSIAKSLQESGNKNDVITTDTKVKPNPNNNQNSAVKVDSETKDSPVQKQGLAN